MGSGMGSAFLSLTDPSASGEPVDNEINGRQNK